MATLKRFNSDEDAGMRMADDALQDLETRLNKVYAQAAAELTQSLDAYMAPFEALDEEMRGRWERGEITETEYITWRRNRVLRTEQMHAQIESLTNDMVNADKIAVAMINDELPGVYCSGYNFAGFKGEMMAQAAGYNYASFSIYNTEAMRIILTEDPDLIPWQPPEVNIPADMRWNRKHIQNAIAQGILQGESIPKISNRLLPLVNMDRTAATRTARTSFTAVQNEGRRDATKKIQDAGIPMQEPWMALMADNTRDTHLMLHGTLPNKDGLYGEGIIPTGNLLRFPADPKGDPEQIYNCRCRVNSFLPGIDHSRDDELYEKMMREEFYNDWVGDKDAPGVMEYKVDEQRRALERKKKLDSGEIESDAARHYRRQQNDVTQTAENILGNAYENHRIENGLRSVSLEEMKNSPFSAVSASYEHISDETANKINKALEELTNEYDTPLCKISTMDASQALGNTTFATTRHNYSTDTAEIILNPMKMNDYEGMTERIMELSERGYCPRIPPENAGDYIITHEFGHTILNMRDTLSNSQNWVDADFEKIRTARKEINEIYDEYISVLGQLENEKKSLELEVIMGTADEQTTRRAIEAGQALAEVKISTYSLTNVDEFLAESFANERLGYKSNPYSERVVAVLDNYFGR